jgi:anaphase-promoting complex subunit 4
VPEKLEVNGRKGRRVVCVLGKDRLHYRVFDLDGGGDVGEDGGEEDEVDVDVKGEVGASSP